MTNQNKEKFEFLVASTEIEYKLICDKLKKSGIRVRIQDDFPSLHYLGGTQSLLTKRIYVPSDKYNESATIINLETAENKKPHWQKRKRDRQVLFQVLRVLLSLVILGVIFYFVTIYLNDN